MRFLCQVPPIRNFLRFSRRLLCSYANCYGDEAVAPSYVRFTELLGSSFHCSVLRVMKIITGWLIDGPNIPGRPFWVMRHRTPLLT